MATISTHTKKPIPTQSPGPPTRTTKDLLALRDDFTRPPLIPNTIFYLTITTPSTDSWQYHGPVPSFAHLIPFIESAIKDSGSASADKKWHDLLTADTDHEDDFEQNEWGNWLLKAPGPTILETGIERLIIPEKGFEVEEGVKTVLEVVREVNGEVWEVLPAPVYTVSCHGVFPTETELENKVGREYREGLARKAGKMALGPAPLAETSRLLGPVASFTTTAAAKIAAAAAMMAMTSHVPQDSVMRSEDWGDTEWKSTLRKASAASKRNMAKSKAHGGLGKSVLGEDKVKRRVRELMGKRLVEPPPSSALLMAFSVAGRWEVRVRYEEPLERAVQRFDGVEWNVERGVKGEWRVGRG
ncbi:hypothetical protein P280DRAFT_544502 [Massarina eburnea CBS 473.64]|uniref:Uncharacterized protein n=1 Tax=Massarina eburnea CBS 473.64 TaxID=1395130 RepID=A0A6A6SGL9_9PLEO|nr:hypothetical protein P280DRAFT_544502 [Massarina eburnea CBS 473.64]